MLSFLAILMNPFFIQDGMIVDDQYYQQMNLEDESYENDDTEVLLSYNGFEMPAGKIMQISQDFTNKSDTDSNSNQQIDEDIEPNPNEAEEPEIQETSARQISQAMEKEFGEMRMIQLANSIAGDMGMITKVTLVG